MALDKVEHDVIAAERALHDEALLRIILRHRATLHDEVEAYMRQLNPDLALDEVRDEYPVFKIRWHHKAGWIPRETVLVVK
jgi:hypothetical protein